MTKVYFKLRSCEDQTIDEQRFYINHFLEERCRLSDLDLDFKGFYEKDDYGTSIPYVMAIYECCNTVNYDKIHEAFVLFEIHNIFVVITALKSLPQSNTSDKLVTSKLK